MPASPFRFLDHTIAPGTRRKIALPLPGLYTETQVEMPVHVVHGRSAGPSLFVSAAVHGDEINGVEIIRRLLQQPALKRLSGTLLIVPVVNVFGFHNKSRYLPDRRDLNRSFPGHEKGSMAGRLAHSFMQHVVTRCDVGIDLHTAAIHRDNLPQIRADLNNPGLESLAKSFAAPVLIHSAPPAGSLRHAAAASDTPVMVFEAGEALRFDEVSIRVGINGIVNVMRACGMLKASRRTIKPSVLLRSTTWVRAPRSGILRAQRTLGDLVAKNDVLAIVADPSGDTEEQLLAPFDGVVIGRTHLPLVYEGEAVFHIGRTKVTTLLEQHMDALQDSDQLMQPEIVEEPEIV